MQRPLTVSQNVRVFVGAAAIALGAMACGSSGGGVTGAAGTSGGAGTGGGSTPCTLDQVNQIFVSTKTVSGCTVTGSCHDASGSAAGLDLLAANWSANLVGHAPSATAGVDPNKSMCAGMGFVYLEAGSNPAKGLFIDKIDPSKDDLSVPCGKHMPSLFQALTADQFACVRSFFTTLTTAAK